MNRLSLILLLISLSGCPVYDPPSGLLTINNKTNAPIYVFLTCNDSLSVDHPLKVYFPNAGKLDKSTTNMEGPRKYPKPELPITKPLTRKDSILSNAIAYHPDFRINAKSKDSLYIGGSPEKPRVDCKNELVHLFFIKEKTLQHHPWKEICKKRLYEQRKTLNSKQLAADNWEVEYNPN